MEGPGRDEQTPLLAGRLLGLRGWMIQSGAGGHPRLAAYWQQASWALGGRWTTARCLADHHPPGEPTPAGSCSCGLYAYNVNRASAEELEAEYWGRNALANPHDPERVQLIGVAGIIEAEGRIELHLDGFRAERARPHALIVGADWPAESRREVERLARACRAGVLELADSRELLEYCRAQGGALGPESVDALLEPEWEQWQNELLAAGIDPSQISHGTYPAPLPVPSEQPPRYGRILERVGELFLLALGGVAALFWYGMWAGILIALAGGILFGWGDEHFKAPARVERVFADRSSCRVDAVVRARRALPHLHLRIVGISQAGRDLGHLTQDVGPVPKGTSKVQVAEMKRPLCDSPQAITVRVRAVFGRRAGHVAQAITRPRRGAVRKRGARATDRVP